MILEKKYWLFSVFFLVLLLVPFLSKAQPEEEFPIRLFSKDHGFGFGIKALVKDRQDFFWIGLETGIQRFDGYQVDDYFPKKKTYSLLKDTNENIWVSNSSGVYIFDFNKETFQPIKTPESDVDNPVKILFQAADGLFYASQSGLYKYNTSNQSFILFDTPFDFSKTPITLSANHFSSYKNHIVYRIKDTLWNENIISKEKTFVTIKNSRTVFAISEEEIIVSNWENKSWYFNTKTQKSIPLFTNTSDRFFIIFDVLRKNADSFYLATYSGLYLFDIKTFQLENVRLSFQGEKFINERYNALFLDKNSRIWAATESSLLFFQNNDNHFHFIKNNSPTTFEPFKEVRAFVEDTLGNYWMATSSGLTYWDTKKQTFKTLTATDGALDKMNHASIRGLVFDGTYLIIGQTNKGIWLYDPVRKLYKRPVYENSEAGLELKQKIEKDFVNQIYTLKNGNHVVAARDGAYILDGKTYQLSALRFKGENDIVKFAYESSRGNLFLGTLKGLYCLDTSYREVYNIVEDFNNPYIISFLEYKDGYYIGTAEGIYTLTDKNNTPQVQKIIPKLTDTWINSIFSDKNQNIWIVAFDKICLYQPQQEILNCFGKTENVLGNSYVSNAFYQNSNEQVFLGAANGITYFYPNKISSNPALLKPKIKYLRIPEKQSNIKNNSAKITIPYSKRNLEAEITVPYYGDYRSLQYKYRLKPKGNWYELGHQNKLILWELSPGDYMFQVAASYNNEQWYTSEEVFAFSIAYPFWQSAWFILLLILSTLLLLYRLIFNFKQKIKIEKTANRFATSLYGKNTVEDILWDTARYCVQNLGFEDCVVYLHDYQRKTLIQKAAFGPKNPYGREINNLLEIPVGKGIVGSVAKSGIPEIVNNTAKDPRYIVDNQSWASEITIPVWVEGKVFAIIDSEHPKKNFYTSFHFKSLIKIAGICAERITKFLTEENLRAKIARDLHDEMGSTLTSININSKIAQQDIPDNTKAQKHLQVIWANSTDMMEKMSDLVWVINPINDNFKNVILKIREYAADLLEPSYIKLYFKSLEKAEFIKLNPEERKNIYLIAKEALNNAIKHSEANEIKIVFKRVEKAVKMTITDNGKGFDITKTTSRNGIKNMQSRAEEIISDFEIDSKENFGTKITLKFNINSDWHYNL